MTGCAGTASLTGSTSSTASTAYADCKILEKSIPALTAVKPFMSTSQVAQSKLALNTFAAFCTTATPPANSVGVLNAVTKSVVTLEKQIEGALANAKSAK